MSFEKSNPDFLYIDAEAMIEVGNEQLKVMQRTRVRNREEDASR